MNRLFLGVATLSLGALCLAGCEQTRPPTPEGLKLIKLRTATGTRNTKLETKTQPSPARAGQISIWDFKVFDIHDKPDGTRTEWKFFKDLPQSSSDKGTTEVLMNAWLISRDKTVFLPQKPSAKQFGSFVTDWTIPQGGPYTLFVEYQPVVAKDELSFNDLKKAPALAVEHARWELNIEGSPSVVSTLRVAVKDGEATAYSLDASDYGASTAFSVSLPATQIKVNQRTIFHPQIAGTNGDVSEQSLTALSPDGQTLVHEIGATPSVTLGQKGVWRAWFSFSVDDKPFAAPFDLNVL
jgi:hypothetical protein